jgi:hypothetical protein
VAYVIVFLVAVGAAVGVFFVTIRAGETPEPGFSPEPTSPSGVDGGSGSYVPIVDVHTDWQTRVAGLLGLLTAVLVAAVVLAAAVYLGFSALIHLVGHAASNGGVSPSA